ncbi:secreted RxLR effector protein 161-like [Cicer arietinum]|uniref:secreted RxLR effector protein 161-like n=1 Tax=Cicer arietinum TaxID=3827 RepID=UPI003CC6972B
MHDPRKTHLTAAKRILRYIKGTKEFGLLFSNGSKGERSELIGYSDSDWCGDLTDRRSTYGYVFKFNEAAISWCTKKQPVTALSSCEAEYIARTFATCQAKWLDSVMKELRCEVMKELRCEVMKPLILRIDNKSAINLAKNPISHGRMQLADGFAKALTLDRFEFLRKKLGVISVQQL